MAVQSFAALTRNLLLLFLTTQSLYAGLQRYSDLLVEDASPGVVTLSNDGVRVTYLGTNGYQFEAAGHALLVDPYFSRIGWAKVILGVLIQSNASRVVTGMKQLAQWPDAILVTHGHFEHLRELPLIIQTTGAQLFA